MNEKTIPLQKLRENSIKIKKPMQSRGDNLHYRALFEQTSECVFIIGLDLQYLTANQQALNMLGYSENELIGMPVSQVMSLDEGLGQITFKGDNSSLYERILNRKDGSKLPVEISTSIVYNDKNEPAYIQSIARDISERKNSEQALTRQARILSVISDATARLIRTSNISTKFPEVLESLGRVMDASSCAIFEINTFSTNPAVEILHHWIGKQLSKTDIQRAIQSVASTLIKSPDGMFIHQETVESGLAMVIVPIHSTLGYWGFLGLFSRAGNLLQVPSDRDVIQTAANLIGASLQRNRYEETIRLNETRNRIIVDSLPDLLIRIDIDGNILDYSANQHNPLYIQRDVISEKKLTQIWPDDIVEKIIGPSNKTTFNSFCWVDGFHLPFNNNIYESRLSPISINEALIVIRDVTEQERLNEAKSDFINRASHELRTPLTSAILMSELLQQGGTPEELQEYWQIMDSELNRQKILIDRLLIAGRLESGMMRMEHAALDLISVLEDSMLAVKPIANKRSIDVILKNRNCSASIIGDKSALQQVFINLLNNAVKFSPEGREVQVELSKTDDMIHVRISDQGMGIPEEAVPHLFERFYRAKNVSVAEIPGSGIGLYIVKSIVEELGGSIQVQSKLNEGTIFIVSLVHSKQDVNTNVHVEYNNTDFSSS